MLEPGTELADFTVDTLVGRGASADVYRVHRTHTADPIALKVLHTEATGHSRARERFEREYSIASLLDHPRIVEMYAHGEIEDTPDTLGHFTTHDRTAHGRNPAISAPTLWLAMQYIGGPPATALIPSPTEEPVVPSVLRLATQIADALDYAHSQEILHRDVKPGNILLTSDTPGADAMLTDFGIAQLLDDTRPLARNGRVQGSIGYAAPELLQATRISPATDLYALACTLTELLTGQPPFPRATAFAVTNAHLCADPPKLTARRKWLPSALNSIFAKALAKDPAARYPTCREFVDVVARVMRDVPVPAPPQTRRGWRQRSVRRRR
ncbi:MAG: serine/threonine-protein kinase [Gordonia sp. (in: high G+C Gram-positive bacteria)]